VVEISTFAPNHRSSGTEPDVRDLAERHLRAVTATDEDAANGGRVISEVPRVAHLYGEALASLDSGRHLFAAQRQTNDLLRIARGEPVARQRVCIWPNVEIPPAKRTLGVDARGARQRRQRALDVLPNTLDHLEIGSENLDG